MLNVSIVLYRTPVSEVASIVALLRRSPLVDKIWLIDNSEKQTEAFIFLPADYIFNGRNLGYGAAHNIALRHTLTTDDARYHLVINSDIDFDPSILSHIINYMEANPDVGQIMPKVVSPDQSVQYLAKLLPTPKDLIMRRFLPLLLSKERNKQYELQNIPMDHPTNVAYLSGCFMMIRTQALRKVGIFDERYFMYPEDIDLTRRIHKEYRTEFYPEVQIVHAHRRSSYHDNHMLWVHIINICRYFNKWGWITDSERTEINNSIIRSLPHKKH